MNQKKNRPSSVIFDNWSIQNSVDLLTQHSNLSGTAQWVVFDKKATGFDDKVVEIKSGSVAALSFHCLCSLLENIVLYDKILVKSGWSSGYVNKINDLDDLFSSKIIEKFGKEPKKYQECNKEYINYLSKDQRIETIIGKYTTNVKKDPVLNYMGQIIQGSIDYLSLSDSTDITYTPHPLRKIFMNDTLHNLTFPRNVASNKFKEYINNSKVRLINKVDSKSFLLHLSTKTPPIALFCILESNVQISPIEIACQLRKDESFLKLKEKLNYINSLFHENETEKYLKEVAYLETVIEYAEKKMNLKKLGENDGFSSLTFFKYFPVRVPEALRKPIFTPKHTVSIAKLIKTTNVDIRNKLQSLFRDSSTSIIEDLELFS